MSLMSSARSPGRHAHQPSFTDHGAHRRRQWVADLLGSAGIAGLAVVVALWLSNGGIQGFGRPGGVGTELGRLSGLVSAYLLLLQVLLMARIPWLESLWGQDVLARRHRLLGFASFDLMLVHIVAITLGYAKSAQSGIWHESWLLLTVYPGMLLAAAGTVALIAVVVTSMRAARRRLRYASWHLIHLYAYLGVGLALPHQLWTGADFTASSVATVFWWGLWIAAAATIVIWRVGFPLFRSARHRLVVERVIRESPEVVSVVMQGRHLASLGLHAGQFCQWRFLGRPGWTRAHPFTVSAVPTADRIRITLRASGDGTRDIALLRPGSRVLLEGPYGIMTAHRRQQRDALLLAAGVGLTTMRGLAEAILSEEPSAGAGGRRRPSVVVLHRIRAHRDALFAGEFAALARTSDLRVIPLLGSRRTRSDWWGGHQSDPPETLLRRTVPDVLDREIYLCGPPEWMRSVRESLRRMGIPGRHVHAEEFGW